MKSFNRSDRVEKEIKKVLCDILLKDIKDPRLEMVTITTVKMSKDLKIANVYFSPSQKQTNKDDIIKGFKKALGYIKRTVASQIKLKYMPDLRFFYDESFDYGTKIEKILKNINN